MDTSQPVVEQTVPAHAAPEQPVAAAGAAAPSSGSTSARAEWLRALRYCAIVLVSVRAGLALVGLLATGLLPRSGPAEAPGWPATQPSRGWHHLVTAFERQDALWYLRIASEGYRGDDNSAAFFPLYPMAVRAVGTVLGGHWLLAAQLVTTVALLAGLVLLYRLTAHELDETAARRAVLYACVFPTGFFLFAPYTEALFLALSVGCLYAARRSLWSVAGYLALLAALTRSQGVLLVAPLAVEALLQLRAGSGPLRPRLVRTAGALAASAAPLLGLATFLLFFERAFGDWRRPFDIQRSGWSKESAWPWETLLKGLDEGTKYFGSYPGGYHTVDLLLVALALACGVWVAVRLRPTWAVYYWLSLLFPMFLMYGGRPLLSIPRFLAVLFPLVWALTAFAQRFRAHDAVVVASAAGMGVLATLFVTWYPMF